MAIVLLVLGLVLSALMRTAITQRETLEFNETQQRLVAAQQALLAFAITYGRLPCPATVFSQGQESPVGGGKCTNAHGFLPGRTLGLSPVNTHGESIDAWHQPIHYVVATESVPPPGVTATCLGAAFTDASRLKTNGLRCLPDQLNVCSSSLGAGFSPTSCGKPAGSQAVGSTYNLANNNTIVALLFSTGKNWVRTAHDVTRVDERINLNATNIFISHLPQSADAPGGEFDDQFTWISIGMLYDKLVTVGQLP